jgi:arsenite methyltransferase
MKDKYRTSPEGEEGSDLSYFELQASWGATKHFGGLKATRELIASCHVDKDTYVLDVGCGVGTNPCYMAEVYGCRVIGVDISEKMVEWSRKRVGRKHLEDRVEFKVADAQALPFEDSLFDAVLCESVTAFTEDKQRVVQEYMRVVKPGGYVGLNESTWIALPPEALIEYVYDMMARAEFLTSDGWKELLVKAGLHEVKASVYKTNTVSEWFYELQQIDIGDYMSAWLRFFRQYCGSPLFRRSANKAFKIPRSFLRIFNYLGYGIYSGRK